MINIRSIVKIVWWLKVMLLVALLAECGGSGKNTLPSSTKTITAFSLVGVPGTVNESAKTIAVTLPYGTLVRALAATFTTTGTEVTVGQAVQTSGVTSNNFMKPVFYTVTAADSSTANYAVTVTVAPDSGKDITAYFLAGVAGAIDETAKTVALTVPHGTNVTALVAAFTTTGVSVTVGATVQESGVTVNNFTRPVEYLVTSADGTTVTYTVTVTVMPVTPVPLGTAGNYVILAESSVSNIPESAINGNIGLYPAQSGGLAGWSETTDVTDTYSTSTQLNLPFKLYAADYVGGSTFADLNAAVLNMQVAYNDAAGRAATSADTTDVGDGTLANLTLVTGVYEWGNAVNIPTDLTLDGSSTDVWVFKVAGTLDMAAATSVMLTGGAQAKNVFWQVSGAVRIGANSHFEGVVLGKTSITLGKLASINGRLLAQTTVILDTNSVSQPAP